MYTLRNLASDPEECVNHWARYNRVSSPPIASIFIEVMRHRYYAPTTLGTNAL